MKFRVAEHFWDGSQPARERELQDALLDLNFDEDGLPPTLVLDRGNDGAVCITVYPPEGEARTIELSFDYLRDQFRDYRDVIAKMARADSGFYGMRDLESLDYAKKLVHDEGGTRLKKALRAELGEISLVTARRLFTLVFLVAVDLPPELVRRHRRHGP